MKDADTSKGNLVLINRIYGYDSTHEVEDIIKVPTKYAYSGVKISESILDSIINLIEAAKEEGYTFVLSDGYRSYKDQEKLYNSYKDSVGIKEADKVVARPGHSEYETGISFNIVPYNKVIANPKESEEYIWLYDNAYKYGFIFRLPDDKVKLTGFEASTWRLRYVGEEAATIINDENLCFEEYYAYYVDKE
jgi:D-alanyl-D-alanine carboxypeptidase